MIENKIYKKIIKLINKNFNIKFRSRYDLVEEFYQYLQENKNN